MPAVHHSHTFYEFFDDDAGRRRAQGRSDEEQTSARPDSRTDSEERRRKERKEKKDRDSGSVLKMAETEMKTLDTSNRHSFSIEKLLFSSAKRKAEPKESYSAAEDSGTCDEDQDDVDESADDDEEVDVDVEDGEEEQQVTLVKPTPVSLGVIPATLASTTSSILSSEEASSLYSSSPHLLYSQWLASRNTSMFFGLQGGSISMKQIYSRHNDNLLASSRASI